MNTILRKRYNLRNAHALWERFLHANYKKYIRSHPTKWRYHILLVLRKIAIRISKFSALYEQSTLYTYPYKKRMKQSPITIIYRYPLYLVRKISKVFLTNWVISLVFKPYVYARYLCGKIDIPHIEIVLTTRCSLRCESCNNLMQYFDTKNAYTCSLEKISESFHALCSVVDSLHYVCIIGGEPLLFKDIAQVISMLENEPKVKSFDIITNGTIRPKEDFLEVLSASSKGYISISDYSTSPNLTTKLHTAQITQTLKDRNISYNIRWQDKSTSWYDPGRIYKRGRDKEGIVKNFKACMMPCVSMMSNESFAFRANLGGGQEHSVRDNMSESHLTSNTTKSTESTPTNGITESSKSPQDEAIGHIFICPVASSLSRLKGLEEFEGDFITLDSHTSKADFRRFYTQEYFKACDYCHDMWETKRDIPIAIQTREVLPLTK